MEKKRSLFLNHRKTGYLPLFTVLLTFFMLILIFNSRVSGASLAVQTKSFNDSHISASEFSPKATAYVSGVINTDTIWYKNMSPYIVTGHVVVETNITLTIEPDVRVQFDGTYYLWIKGILKAIGTPTERIIFTSNKETPRAGDWTGIFFSDSSMDAVFDGNGNWINGSIIKYAIIEYGGGGSGPVSVGGGSGGILLYAACPYIDNNILRYNSGSSAALFFNGYGSGSPVLSNNTVIYNGLGMNIQQGSPLVSNNLIMYNSRAMFTTDNPTVVYNAILNNSQGIEVTFDGPNMKINYNDIYGNGYNVYMRFDALNDVNATYNYWGTMNTTLIAEHIYDKYDDPSLGKVNYSPISDSTLEVRSAAFREVHLRTLTVNTNGVSASEPVTISKDGANAGTVSDDSPLNVTVFRDVPTVIETDEARIWYRYISVRYKFLMWDYQNSTTSRISITLTENSAITAFYKTQCLTDFFFRDNSGTILYVDPEYIVTVAPNGSLVTFSSYENQWLDNGTWTLKEAIWQNNNVNPVPDPTCFIEPGPHMMWWINCRVYEISFANSFKDNDGNTLYTLPSSFRLTFPNGTTSAPLDPSLSYHIQNGNTTWTSIIWQGTEVVPEGSSFDATDGNPTVNCRVYSLTINPTFNDDAGSVLYMSPSSWVIKFPNGTTTEVASSSVTFGQTQAGEYSLVSVVWQGIEVAPDVAPYISLTANQLWSPSINCKVYSLSFSFFGDGGLGISPDYWLVEAPNGTISSALTEDIPQAQAGKWEVVAVMWRGTNVARPGPIQMVTPWGEVVTVWRQTVYLETNYNWHIYCLVYQITISWKTPSGEILYINPERVVITFPNDTDVTLESYTFLVQNGTCTMKEIIWQSSNVIPPVYPTFDATNGDPTIIVNVHSINFAFKDRIGVWPVNPSQFTLQFPNGTLKNVTSNFIPQTQNGTYTITEIIWQGRSIIPTIHPSTTISSNYVWPINCEVASSFTISTSASTMYIGFQVTVSGVLTNWPAGNIPGATVILSYRVPGVSTWNLITSVTTESDGSFSAIWIPSATGYYTINASWTGDDVFPGANVLIDLAVTPFAERYVFSVSSNSTVSALAFNSTSRELSFIVSGPSGTTGYVKVIIAKELVANASDIKVYLDGNHIEYTISSLDDSWLLHFTYTHSDHAVAIGLGLTPASQYQQYPWTLLVAAIATIAVAGFVAVMLIRRKRAP